MLRLTALLLITLLVPAAVAAGEPAVVRVRLDTSAGPIIIALDTKHAPRTSANFLAYVDDGRFDGTRFYRSARSKYKAGTGFIQGGIQTDARRILPSFPFESTKQTGIRHLDATVSMARGSSPSSAGGNFVITVGPAPGMDARGDYLGYAAFGHVVGGMTTVKHILALRTGGGSGAMRGQMILKPIRLVKATRLNGTAKPTGRPKVWKLGLPSGD